MFGDICFYANETLGSKIIRFVTHSDYSHCAIDLGDNSHVFSADNGGVTKRPIGHPLCVIPTSKMMHDPQFHDAMAWLLHQEGAQYDYTNMLLSGAILFLPFVRPIKMPFQYFCSELAVEYLCRAGYPFSHDFLVTEAANETTTPAGLYKAVREVQPHD